MFIPAVISDRPAACSQAYAWNIGHRQQADDVFTRHTSFSDFAVSMNPEQDHPVSDRPAGRER